MRTRIPTICTSYKHSIQNHPLPFFFKITQIILFLIPILSNFLSNPSNNSYISINILACSKTLFSFFKKVIQTRFLLSNSLYFPLEEEKKKEKKKWNADIRGGGSLQAVVSSSGEGLS